MDFDNSTNLQLAKSNKSKNEIEGTPHRYIPLKASNVLTLEADLGIDRIIPILTYTQHLFQFSFPIGNISVTLDIARSEPC